MIKFSAPGKIHLLGEHSVVYGKPALLTTVNLRVTVSVILSERSESKDLSLMRDPIEHIVKKHLKIKTIPPYQLSISSQIPIGAGLGSSAATSASYIAVLLSFLKIKWDLNLINDLTYQAEKIWHGNPSGADNSTVVFGPSFSIPHKLAKNFVLINTGQPKETTADMVKAVRDLYDKKPKRVERFLENQEKLVRELLSVVKDGQESELIKIIKAGQRNLESIGVVSSYVVSIIRKIETNGGAAKICGGGGKTGPTGVLLCYHPNPSILIKIAKSSNLDYFKTALGVEGLRQES